MDVSVHDELFRFFSQLKRSIDVTHRHVSVEHLPRYLAEFNFPLLHSEDERHRSHVSDDRTGGRATAHIQGGSLVDGDYVHTFRRVSMTIEHLDPIGIRYDR